MDKHLNLLLDKVGCKNRGVKEIPVRPESYSKIEDCFNNVAAKVSRDSGLTCYGWKLHKGNFIYEAERHAIWLSPDNELVDITPESNHISNSLFVEDNEFVYQGQFVDNIRINITGNSVVDDFITICEIISQMWQLGERNLDGSLLIPEPIAKAIEVLNNQKMQHELFILSGGKADVACYCGRLKAYKNCHGQDIQANASSIIDWAKSIKASTERFHSKAK